MPKGHLFSTFLLVYSTKDKYVFFLILQLKLKQVRFALFLTLFVSLEKQHSHSHASSGSRGNSFFSPPLLLVFWIHFKSIQGPELFFFLMQQVPSNNQLGSGNLVVSGKVWLMEDGRHEIASLYPWAAGTGLSRWWMKTWRPSKETKTNLRPSPHTGGMTHTNTFFFYQEMHLNCTYLVA